MSECAIWQVTLRSSEMVYH